MLLRFWPCRQCAHFKGLQWSNIKHNSSYSKKNYYQVLQVEPSSDSKQIKDNYYKLSKEFHPDVNKDDPIALARFKEVVEAYEVLSSPDEKQKYDNIYGFNAKPKVQFRRVSRKFERGGINERGEFVDSEGPPEMRNIQYDLSPEKMEKIWKRYKERWDKTDEIERMKELKKKKVEFRKRIDERRANMKNMTPAEKEDFLFNLRMLRTDEGVTGRTDSEIKASQKEKEASQKQNNASYKESNNPFSSAGRKSNIDDQMHTEEDTSSGRSETRERFNREKEKVNHNLNWKEELRQQIKEKLKEEEEKMKGGRTKAERFYRQQYQAHNDEQEEKIREEYKKYQDSMFDFGENDDETTKKKESDHFNPKEDPFLYGLKMDNPASMKEWANASYERSKETIQEIKTSRPFTYHQQSIKHGVVYNSEVKWGTKLGIVSALIIFIMFMIESNTEISYDTQMADQLEEMRKKKRDST